MKKINSLLIAICVIIGISEETVAQKKGEIADVKYRRSSLHTVLIQSDGYEMFETVEGAYFKTPFPDKYNNHDVGLHKLNRADYVVTDEEREAGGKKRTKGGALGAKLLSNATAGITDPTMADVPFQMEKFIDSTKIANKLVAKWFNRKDDGSFDMQLIQERGMYDASEIDKTVASGSARGSALLADAGEELISKTFVVFNKMRFVENEAIAAAARDVALVAASRLPGPVGTAAAKTAEVAYLATKNGYTVFTTSFLYKLVWNDSVAAVFYNDLWLSEGQEDANRKEAFDNTDLFQLEFIGKARASSVVMPFGASKKPQAELVELVTVRNVDAVYAKLQREFDVFKPMTPIYSVDPVTAQIGMKEGIEPGDKFEVLEQLYDEKTQRTKYKRKTVLKAVKGKIWDNRVHEVTTAPTESEVEEMVEKALAGEETEAPKEEVNEAALLKVTTFKGGKGLYPGMLLRQIK